jgi:hypothetical protein
MVSAAMPLKIVSYLAEHATAVGAFNERARAHEAPFVLSKSPVAEWLPMGDGARVWREFFLALDGAEVRGGYALRRQEFWLRGAVLSAGNYQGPLAEGRWDRRYMTAGVQMLRAALREEPLLYALGMGGLGQPLPKLLASAGWALTLVPFRFRVLRARSFLRNIQALRKSAWQARALDMGAATGLGTLGFAALDAWKKRRRLKRGCAGEPVAEFGAWADEVWAAARGKVAFCAVRDRAVQNALFAASSDRNLILRCTREGRDIGWAVVRSTQMEGDQYFGHARVGSLVDALAVPGEEFAVAELAVRHLRELGSDLVVTNQTHERWLGALREGGWLEGPSNFVFAASPELAKRLGSLEEALPEIHFNRADGDGPIHL